MPSPAHAEPDDDNLVLAGLAMAPPMFFLGTLLHEGTHAMVAHGFGADIIRFRFWPSRHPVTRTFYFGYVSYRGRLSRGEKAFFLFAPKLTNLALFSGWAALYASDSFPDEKYSRLALSVFATGLWVDFSKDIIAWRPTNDIVRVYNMAGIDTEWKKLPFRLFHAGLSIAAAYLIYESYEDVFEDETDVAARIVPLLQGRF